MTEPHHMVKGQGSLLSFHDLPLSTCLLVYSPSPSISATTLGESELSPNGSDRLSFVGALICASISVHVAIEVVGGWHYRLWVPRSKFASNPVLSECHWNQTLSFHYCSR